jgi:hypothetical protein
VERDEAEAVTAGAETAAEEDSGAVVDSVEEGSVVEGLVLVVTVDSAAEGVEAAAEDLVEVFLVAGEALEEDSVAVAVAAAVDLEVDAAEGVEAVGLGVEVVEVVEAGEAVEEVDSEAVERD